MKKSVFPHVHGLVLLSLLGLIGCYSTSDGGPFGVSAEGGGFPFTHDDMELVSQKAWEGCLEVSADTLLESDVPCIRVGADGITIDLNGYTVHGPILPGGGTIWNDVEVRNGTVAGGAIILGSGTVLDQLIVRDHPGFTVEIGGGLITNSLFERNGSAVDLYWSWSSAGHFVEVRDCRFVENRVGVAIQDDDNSKVINNHFEANEIGVYIWDEDLVGASNSEIRQNRFIRNDLGIWLNAVSEANGTQISKNLFQSNSSSGIAVSLGCAMEYGNPFCAGRGTVIEKNKFIQNGNDPRTLTGRLWLPDFSGEPYEVVADDGLTVFGIEELNTADGVTVIGNTAIKNADLGIDAAGVIDGGANLARQNGNESECVGVACR